VIWSSTTVRTNSSSLTGPFVSDVTANETQSNSAYAYTFSRPMSERVSSGHHDIYHREGAEGGWPAGFNLQPVIFVFPVHDYQSSSPILNVSRIPYSVHLGLLRYYIKRYR
jgi:hypothetical protein